MPLSQWPELSCVSCTLSFLSFQDSSSSLKRANWCAGESNQQRKVYWTNKEIGKKEGEKKYLIVGSKLNNSNQIPSPRHESIVYKKRGINLIWNAFLSTAEYSATCVRYRVRCICVPVWCNLRNSLWTSHGDRNGIIFFPSFLSSLLLWLFFLFLFWSCDETNRTRKAKRGRIILGMKRLTSYNLRGTPSETLIDRDLSTTRSNMAERWSYLQDNSAPFSLSSVAFTSISTQRSEDDDPANFFFKGRALLRELFLY